VDDNEESCSDAVRPMPLSPSTTSSKAYDLVPTPVELLRVSLSPLSSRLKTTETEMNAAVPHPAAPCRQSPICKILFFGHSLA